MNEENPSFYAIIPANVRYADITPNAKLLYGEITALCNKTGVCYASNDYFAKLYNVSKISISKWINELVNNGFITSEIIKSSNKQILNRYIRIVYDPIKENFNTPIKENFKDNNTYTNNTFKKKEIYKESFEEWWENYPKDRAGNKTRAYQKYVNAIEKEKLTPKYLLEKVKEYANSEEVSKGYACGAEVYFNKCKYNNKYKSGGSDFDYLEKSLKELGL